MRKHAKGSSILLLALASALSGCTFVAPTMPQAVYPRDFPQVPPPSAAAALVPAGYRVEVVVKDLEYPTSVETDEAGNLYIAEAGYAYGDPVAPARILRVAPDGKINIVAEQLRGPINDIMWHGGRLYISHFGRISALEANGTVRDLVTGLPATAGHQNNQMSVGPDGKIYFGMGTATNSGVVGLDEAYPFMGLLLWPDVRDIPARDIRLRGVTYTTPHPNNVLARQGALTSLWSNLTYAVTSVFNHDVNNSMLVDTGAFQPFGHAGATTVKGETKSNGTILRMNADGSGLEVYAWGFRNPYGVRWSPDGRLFASENAYDERGSRPIANAEDNMWVVRQNAWYGWPDYSSGIPVTDPRFRSTRGPAPEFLMAEHPPVEKPLFTRPKHAALTKFDFSRSAAFGFQGEMFLGEFGAGVPITGADGTMSGQQVVRVNPATGQSEPFFRARPEALGPRGQEYVQTAAPKHPVDVRFSRDGNALYIADIGALKIYLAGAGPFPRPWPTTGVIWRVTRDNAPAARPPANLSPLPPRANQ
ncbi:MAG TPA: PQQ-dependent sugar dehydrogenase [Deinococcales bacterium]|nr:PQQ-dependent sugar dehydrogenase [Deinococcales bacterium]